MNKHIFLGAVILAGLMQPAQANPVSRRATITGGGGSGRCTIEVTVDGTAEVEVLRRYGLLTTTGGQPAEWRRFQCNAALPRTPRTSASSGSMAGEPSDWFRILATPEAEPWLASTTPRGGRAGYTFDLQWGGLRGGGGWTPGPPLPPGPPPPPSGVGWRTLAWSLSGSLSRPLSGPRAWSGRIPDGEGHADVPGFRDESAQSERLPVRDF